jgi:putative tryptophan/tyrosine transport system substrate-binding protein
MQSDRLRRREFITLLGGAAAWPLAARAQQRGQTYRVGWLQPVPIPDAWLNAFRQGLQEFNYVEGKNLIIEYRWGDGNFDRLPAMAAELIQLNVDVIISGNTAALLALQRATRTIPIVMLGPGDPLATGLATSLARPEGNITGLSLIAPEVSGKRLELLKELMPKLARVMVLSNPNNRAVVLGLRETQAAAQTLGLKLDSVDMRAPSELDRALSVIVERRPDALVLLSDSMILSRRAQIATFAVKQRLPSISPFREFAEAGGLMSYGPSLPDIYRRGVGYINKILRGTNPSELPIEQPTKFELVINLKTAKEIGLELPWFLQQRADEVIE